MNLSLNKTIFLILVFLTIFRPFSELTAKGQEEIIVDVSAEHPLVPVYIEPSFLPDPLYQILLFDFKNNGTTTVLEKGDPRIDIEIIPTLSEKTLSCKIHHHLHSQVLTIDGLNLTGDPKSDRKVLHRLSDTIHLKLFGEEGIASLKFLYTVKPKSNLSSSDVFEADYDGEGRRQLTQKEALVVNPIYIPPKPGFKSGNFVYVSFQTGQSKLMVGSLASDSPPFKLLNLRGNQLMPTISKDRNQLAFISDASGNPDLFLVETDPDSGLLSKPRQIFAISYAAQGTPTLSPDGKKIAFVSNKDGTPRIYMMNVPPVGAKVNEIQPKLLSSRAQESTAPHWSPDGKKIAFSSMVQGRREIMILDLPTMKLKQLTSGPGSKENPAFAPNSLHILYNVTTEKGSDIFLNNIYHPQPVRITKGPGEKRFPSWEPKN